MTWAAVPCAESYEIYRAETVEGPYDLADCHDSPVQKLHFTGTTLELVARFTAPDAVDVASDSQQRVIVLGDATIRVFERR